MALAAGSRSRRTRLGEPSISPKRSARNAELKLAEQMLRSELILEDVGVNVRPEFLRYVAQTVDRDLQVIHFCPVFVQVV